MQLWPSRVHSSASGRSAWSTRLAQEVLGTGEAMSVQRYATHCLLPACPQLKTMTPDQRAAAERAQQVALRLLASGPQSSSLQQPSTSMAMPSAPTNINPVVAAAQAAAMAVAQKVRCQCLICPTPMGCICCSAQQSAFLPGTGQHCACIALRTTACVALSACLWQIPYARVHTCLPFLTVCHVLVGRFAPLSNPGFHQPESIQAWRH